MLRLAIAILVATAWSSAAEPGDSGKFDLSLFRIKTNDENSKIDTSLAPGAESVAHGAVELRYEQILLLCDQVRYVQTLFPGTKVAILDHGEVNSGPTGPKPNQVIFDSLATSLVKMPLRIRMTPSRIRCDRIATPAESAVVPGSLGLATFTAVLSDLGEFTGDSRTKVNDGFEWKGLSGWAATVEATLVGDVVPKGLANTRLREMRFHGHPGDSDHQRRNAEINRYKRPIGGVSMADLAAEPLAGYVKGRMIRVTFDDDGNVVNSGVEGYAEGSTPDVFPKRGTTSKTAPASRGKEVIIGTITSVGSDRLDLTVKKHPHPAIPTDAQTTVTTRDGTVLALADLVAGQEVEITLANGIARSIRIVGKK